MGKFLAVASFYNNTEEYIQQTFDNILNQTHKDWLLIVGDDFSEDEEFRRKLKAKVEALNDKRVLYYPTQFKRELYLYQNTFQHLEYDYYFDLDVDDILDPNLFTLYDKHFNDLPNVYSIFSDYVQRNVEGESTTIPFKGGARFIINGLTDGVKSAFSYAGANNIMEYYNRAEYNVVTGAGLAEAKPHLIS